MKLIHPDPAAMAVSTDTVFMRWLYYTFLACVSLGIVGLIAAIIIVVGAISYYSRDLPDYRKLKDYNPPVVTRVHAGDGRLLAEFAQEQRVFVPVEEIPALVKNAFISAEDQNFYSHPGIDMIAILRAVVTNLQNLGTGRRPEGASTITQQVAKNFLLTNEVSIERKIREAILAFRMERVMSKGRLLELYLNEIFLGSRSYGVASAALNYFGKSLDQLTIAEAAYLAALPKAPNNYHPLHDHERALARRNWVLERMVEEGYITSAQGDLARASPLKMNKRADKHIVKAPYFAEEVRRELKDRYGDDGLYKGGLSVRTSVNPDLQTIAKDALRDGLMAYDRRHGWRGPVDTLSDISAWQDVLGNRSAPSGMLDHWRLAVVLSVTDSRAELGFTSGDRATLPLKGAKWARKALRKGYIGKKVTSLRQVVDKGDIIMVAPMDGEEKRPGDKRSADKEPGEDSAASHYALRQVPEVQGALMAMDPHTGRILAMEGGWKFGESEFNRATQARRQPGSAFKPFVYLAALDSGFTPATLILDAPFVIEDRPGNIWKPENYGRDFHGPTPLRVGIEKSRNLMTVRLADHVGMDKIARYAAQFGIAEDMRPLLANALGATETTLMRLTRSYAMLVNGGRKIKPTFIDRVQNRYGETVFRHDARPCPDCGDRIGWFDQPVPAVPDARARVGDPQSIYQVVSLLKGVVQRGTGRRLRTLDRPIAGKTGTTNESRDTWFVGFTPDLVAGVYIGFDDPKPLGKRETGAATALPVFKQFMEKALEGVPPTPFRTPPGIRMVQINAETGQRATAETDQVIWEAFKAGSEPTDEIYVLDTGGITKMPHMPGGMESPEEAATTGTGGIY